MTEVKRKVCKRCLLRDMAEADIANLEKYKKAIKESDRVSDEEYESRLKICKGCNHLSEGTCNACGCYVELRALGRATGCPYKMW